MIFRHFKFLSNLSVGNGGTLMVGPGLSLATPLFLSLVFFMDMHWQVLEYLKIVLKYVTERVNFIKAGGHVFKVPYEDELIDLQC